MRRDADNIRENAPNVTRHITIMEFQELQQIVESTARSLQSLSDDVAEMRLGIDALARNAAEERAELRAATIGIANLLSSLDSDRPTILRKLSTIENKVDRLLEEKPLDGNSA